MAQPSTRKANAAETALAQSYDALREAFPGSARVRELRAQAYELVKSQGLPTRRVEAWHYSDLRAAIGDGLPLAGAPDEASLEAARTILPALDDERVRIVLVDGFYAPALSTGPLTGDILVRALDEALAEPAPGLLEVLAPAAIGAGDTILALNAAFMRGGVVIGVEPGYKPALPVEIVFVTAGAAPRSIVSRSLVRAGAGSAFTVVERHLDAGGAPAHVNEALVLLAGTKSQVEHVAIFGSGPSAQVAVRSLIAQVWDDAELKSFGLVESCGFARRQIFARFQSQRSSLSRSGAALLDGKCHADTTLVVDHAHPHNVSREYFKHIVGDAATGVFQGKITVAPVAQKTDGAMKSQTILLSDGAAMYNKPELEIFADDVVCGHGATVGALDPNQLFYAMSRGLPRPEAEALLLEAFLGDAVESVSHEVLREEIMQRVRARLAGRMAS